MYYIELLSKNEIQDEDFLVFYDNFDCVFTQYKENNMYNIEVLFKDHKDIELFISACKFIGLLNEDTQQWESYKRNKASISETEINNKIALRNKARDKKDYKEADRIRDELLDKGVLIEDKDGKTIWKFR